MIISGNNGIGKANKVYGVDQIKTGKGVRESGKSGSTNNDAVVLSSEAQELQQAVSAIKALSGVREDRVQELTPLVESGQYKVEAAKIADQMIGRVLADRLK
ncbi:MAG TPA: flagellar biosynthesis anti-sigma factor FlgM [Negativicutes bacterium]|nr:flagellar biosynthesis anti-sigma factor FlgM [Negativicutes bacterium]